MPSRRCFRREISMTGNQRDHSTERDREDKPPGKGTDEPWKRPGQSSQNPDQPEPKKPDLEKWKRTETH